MIKSIILYGSKARGDHDRFSDTDLMGVSDFDDIQKPFDQLGVSLHLYPHSWLQVEAKSGSLFLLHIATEAVPMFDPSNVLDGLRSDFQYRPNYIAEREMGSRVISAAINLEEEAFTSVMRRRYFWGLRTALMADLAEKRTPKFSAQALEKYSGLLGLALHIQTRSDASLPECQRFGSAVLKHLGTFEMFASDEDKKNNVRYLFGVGGVGTATAAEIIYGFKPPMTVGPIHS